ncbi:YceK/YidQ family lipoprotein [Candidatus Pantoea multigeneris]|uniref:YceK/YidQ family lipoprotein n=1 Tax=Candidatus Pantoea multigeneris TaxID=2608357 RepID=A0ABX0RJZ6_9GAMM|nr:YceK/YidQ family lipoprotein [Pantoea multigeneris]NIF24453.1 YceK/YidQ family lipoprotein [Pantoea multigeneris]
MKKMMKKMPLAGMLVCCSVTSGCASVMSHTGGEPGYYSGTRASADVLSDGNASWAMKPLALIDLPFSAVMDTVLLPWDYFRDGSKDPEHQSIRDRVLTSEQQNHTSESLAQAAPGPGGPDHGGPASGGHRP